MKSPYLIEGPTCINLSGGRTSAHMLKMILNENGGIPACAVVLFCNTGKEEELTLRFVREIGLYWGVTVIWLEYRPGQTFAVVDYETASRNGEPFTAVIADRDGVLPNRVARYCSSEMKTRTMHRYLRSMGWTEWDTFIGIRADEPARVAKFRQRPSPETPDEVVCMPSAAAGVTRAIVGDFWRASEFDLRLISVNGETPEGNCDLCFLKKARRVLSLISARPSRAVWWAQCELRAETITSGNGSRFRNDRPSYGRMAEFAKSQVDVFGHENDEAIQCACMD